MPDLPSTDELLSFTGQETADADHLAIEVIHDLRRGLKTAGNLGEAYLRLRDEYFLNNRAARLWILECLHKLIEYRAEEEDDTEP